jgi:hypothetical protein
MGDKIPSTCKDLVPKKGADKIKSDFSFQTGTSFKIKQRNPEVGGVAYYHA